MRAKIEALERELRAHAPLLVAFSGGVDSSFLLAIARRVLGDKMRGVIADSPSLPRQALADALDLARNIDAPVEVIRTTELDDPNYSSNPINRCYFCKAELFSKMSQFALKRRFAAIAYGENADDATHFRPGAQAAEEFAVLAPLKSAGLAKDEIRELSRELNLPTADLPAQPCLSSRIPHGTPVTTEALAMIERSEALVRELGFKIFRVRHVADTSARLRARLQFSPNELDAVPPLRERLAHGLAAIGYESIEIDPAGYHAPA
jgi:uncharacterized protein